MFRLRTVSTQELTAGEVRLIRDLLEGAFGREFSEQDWEHTLGGMHTLVLDIDDGAVVGHVAVVPRRVWHRGRWLSTGYVEGLGVRGDRRRLGHAGAAMREAERVISATYELGALSDGTGIAGFYQRRGWLPWRGPTSVVTPDGQVHRTPADDADIRVWRTPHSPELDPTQGIACDWRSGDVW